MTPPNNTVICEVHWPPDMKLAGVVAGLVGGVAIWFILWPYFWGELQIGNILSKKFALVLCAAGPFGAGLFISACQRVEVYSIRIENHQLGFCRTLELETTRVAKVCQNGFWLKDLGGSKIFIHNWMIGKEKLLEVLKVG